MSDSCDYCGKRRPKEHLRESLDGQKIFCWHKAPLSCDRDRREEEADKWLEEYLGGPERT